MCFVSLYCFFCNIPSVLTFGYQFVLHAVHSHGILKFVRHFVVEHMLFRCHARQAELFEELLVSANYFACRSILHCFA